MDLNGIELNTPEDIRPLHRQLMEHADSFGHGRDDAYLTAARTLHALWRSWLGRMHATDARPDMRIAANQALKAVNEALYCFSPDKASRWFEVAEGWISDLRMQAEVG